MSTKDKVEKLVQWNGGSMEPVIRDIGISRPTFKKYYSSDRKWPKLIADSVDRLYEKESKNK